jgi:hypothetical protein
MTFQELVAYAIGLLAVGFLLVRYLRRRASASCCGEAECPAAAETARKLARSRR